MTHLDATPGWDWHYAVSVRAALWATLMTGVVQGRGAAALVHEE
eukprot:CAMPEP_0174363564 /NCGR_PEP_ID=MMETSP0811_2-20130205/69325_1 /TAXON_ID=73025 ORGANISM="Eutreptiella gymnastica-like, Strain CCMP1594" /NCGR_SAMPLE_ID=MMETSP0811_2 /ASSEMBLY_ACC=CAM_ASM_000667 /LENGTH=43 /DNA_ID= /DNA_START= /DNA_END= /DNA_ORIENTATION=